MTDGDESQPEDGQPHGDVTPAREVTDAVARRPLIERLGLAAIALALAILFGGVALASWFGGELFLAIMAGIGALMTAWAGAITLTRG